MQAAAATNKLAFSRVVVSPAEGPRLLDFYKKRLGFKELRSQTTPAMQVTWLGFGPNNPSAGLELRVPLEAGSCANPDRAGSAQQPSDEATSKSASTLRRLPYSPKRNSSDVYWKIGLSLPDVDLAAGALKAQGVSVGQASQFIDIGYLAHLRDPASFAIELLQHTFEKNFKATTPDTSAGPLLQPVTMGQITLRARDAQASIDFWSKALGMAYLSLQEAKGYYFSLLFFAYTHDTPPSPHDVAAVCNREWLWQKQYTQIEVQVVEGTGSNRPPYAMPDVDVQDGFAGVGIFVRAGGLEAEAERLRGLGLTVEEGVMEGDVALYGRHFVVRDPEGVPVTLMEALW